MGVSGYAPFESDDFGDMDDEVVHAVRKPLVAKIAQLLKRVRSADPAEKWAAIGLVLVAYHSTYASPDDPDFESCVETAIEYHAELAADEEWLGRWRGRGFPAMLKRVGDDLEKIKDGGWDKRPRQAARAVYAALEPTLADRNRRRRKNPTEEDEVDEELGVDNPQRWPKSEVQSLLFDTDEYTAQEAKEWAREHDYLHGKVDTTGRYHRLRQEAPMGGPCRTVEFGKGIRAIVCSSGRGRPPGVPNRGGG